MKSITDFLAANPWVVALVSMLFTTAIHALSGKSPRVVAALQAVQIDGPKLYQAITNTLPPPGPPAPPAAKLPPGAVGMLCALSFAVCMFVGCVTGCAAVPKILDLAVTDAPLALCVYEAVDHGAKSVADVIAACPQAAQVAAHDVEILMGSHRLEMARAGACKP